MLYMFPLAKRFFSYFPFFCFSIYLSITFFFSHSYFTVSFSLDLCTPSSSSSPPFLHSVSSSFFLVFFVQGDSNTWKSRPV